MNVEISGFYLNGFTKPDYKNKETGEIVEGDFIIQLQQKKELPNGQTQFESYDIPIDRSMAKSFQDKKMGDVVKVLCNVYGENFAQLKFGKAKK